METHALPSSCQEDQAAVSLPHKLIWKLNVLLATLLQVKLQIANESQNFATIVAFIVAIIVYCVTWYAEKKVAEKHPNSAGIVGYYARLCGILSIALLVRMLVPAVGLIVLAIWGCCFFTITFWSYRKIIKAVNQVTIVVIQKIKILMSRRSFHTEKNESTNEEDDSVVP